MSTLEERLTAALKLTADAVQQDTLRPLAVPDRRRRWPLIVAPVAAAMAVLLIVGIEAGVGRMAGLGNGPATSGAVSLGGAPSGVAFDPAAKTIYVAERSPQDALALVGTSACNASTLRGCGQLTQVSSGGEYPQDVAFDARTRTVYVLNGNTTGHAATLALIDAARCNASTTSGCAPRMVLRLPRAAMDLAVNPRNDAVYIFYNRVGQISAINGQTCNATNTTGCAPRTAAAPQTAEDIPVFTVDPVTNTLYYAAGRKLLVIDGRTCNGADVRGCGTVLGSAPLFGGADALAIDQSTGTLYAAGIGAGSVTVVNRNACNALKTTGCAGPLRVIRGGPIPMGVVADPASGTVYVSGQSVVDGVWMINASACRAGASGGCPALPAEFATGAGPQQMVLDTATHTLYVTNVIDRTISVVNTATCNVADTRGCPPMQPRVSSMPARACAGATTIYYSGLPAGRLVKGYARVTAGSVGGHSWSLWAPRGAAEPDGVEQGGLVVDGRWYGLCDHPGFRGGGASLEFFDLGGHGVAYGLVQHPNRVKLTLSAAGKAWSPSAVRLNGATFYISWLPRSSCSYPSMTLHVVSDGGPVWSGHWDTTIAACAPGRLDAQGGGNGGWGPGLGN